MKLFFSSILLLLSLGLFAQIEDPIKWSTSVEKVSETEYLLVSILMARVKQ